MSDTPPLNITVLSGILLQRKKLIVATTMATIVLGILYFIVKPSRYQAEIVFILKNPLYSDRNYLYNNETKFIDYFANDDDMDRLITMARSDNVQNKIIAQYHLAVAYKFDTTRPKQMVALRKYFNKNLNIYRSEGKNVVLTYTDKDQKRAISIARTCLADAEHALHGFYISMRNNMQQSIINKIHDEDSAIRALTDTLSLIRIKYGIYDIISPSRYNIMLSSFKDNGKVDFARGIEEIQNVESVKDQLVSDKARNISLADQYATGTGANDLPFTYVVNTSPMPLKPRGLGILAIVAICTFTGAFFSSLYVLALSFFRKIRSTQHGPDTTI